MVSSTRKWRRNNFNNLCKLKLKKVIKWLEENIKTKENLEENYLQKVLRNLGLKPQHKQQVKADIIEL